MTPDADGGLRIYEYSNFSSKCVVVGSGRSTLIGVSTFSTLSVTLGSVTCGFTETCVSSTVCSGGDVDVRDVEGGYFS